MGNSKDKIWDKIKVEWNAGGFVSLATAGVYSGLTLLADNSENAFVGGAILATAIGIKALMSGISLKKKGKSVEEEYLKCFYLTTYEAAKEYYDEKDIENVLGALSNVTDNTIDMYAQDLGDISNVIYQILIDAKIKTDMETVGKFMHEVVETMTHKIKNDEKLRGYISHQLVIEIYKNLQENTNTTEAIYKNQQENTKTLNKIEEYVQMLWEKYSSQNTNGNEPTHKLAPDFETIKENIKNEKDKYIEKWHAKLFLESIKQKSVKGGSTPKEEKTLENTYINHGYKDIDIYSSSQSYRIENFEKTIENIINNANKQDKILITGEPGVGKTSLVACLADKFANDDKVFFIDFRKLNEYFKESLTKDKRNILSAVAEHFGTYVKGMQAYIKDVLKEQKVTLIFDGFDEFIADGEVELLICLLTDDLLYKNISVIITSRINYIKHLNENRDFVRLFNKWYNLEGFSDKNIKDYYENIIGEELPKDKEIPPKNKDVLGIPVILYMSLSLGIDIFADADRYEMYSKIFALRGGIFDRFADIVENNQGYDEDRREKIIKLPLYYLMQMLAFALFENDEEPIAKADYLKLTEHIRDEKAAEHEFDADYTANAFDYPVKNILEGEGRIEFVHKTIYEYFIALKIFNEIKALYDVNHIIRYEPQDEQFIDFTDGFVKRFGSHFKIGKLIRGDETAVYDFLEAMLKEAFEQGRNRNSFFYRNLSDMSILSAGFGKMYEKGLSYYTIDYSKKDIFVKNTKRYSAAKDVNALMETVNEQEQTCFKNMIDLIQLIRQVTGKENDLFESKGDKYEYRRYICRYLKMGLYNQLNLSSFDLSYFEDINNYESNLSRVDMSGYNLKNTKLNNSVLAQSLLLEADLSDVKISGAVFKGALLEKAKFLYVYLYEVDFSNTDLRYAFLKNANIINSNFTNCNLEFADLTEATIKNCDFTGARLGGCRMDIKAIRNPDNNNIITDRTNFTGAEKLNRISSPEEIYIGGTLEFGSYLQGADGKEEPILWRVLDIVDGYALLLSDKILDCKLYHKDRIDITWSECTLNEWLNNDFYNNAFNETFAEKTVKLFSRKRSYAPVNLQGCKTADLIIKPKDILATEGRVIAGKNDNCNRVFLLSNEELHMYFDRRKDKEDILSCSLDGEHAAAYGTEYAKKRNLFVNSSNGRSEWWLRSSGSDNARVAMSVHSDGDVDTEGCFVDFVCTGVRPSLWLNLKS
ncbi:MAG: pentapeptide repeat-containing protein [Lachnospiraceae bacterium]|nr:pentapeptide repeat-containing protein [Lachnospiraceae bacterium]